MYVPLDILGVLSLFEECEVSFEPSWPGHPASGPNENKTKQIKLKTKYSQNHGFGQFLAFNDILDIEKRVLELWNLMAPLN